MTEKKLTRRQQITIRMLQEAYVDLAKEMDPSDITIVKLCRAADVNRTTFYRYYVDLDEFSTTMVKNLFDQIFSVLGQAEVRSISSRRKIMNALTVTVKNKKLLQHLISDSHNDLAKTVLEEKLTLIKEAIMGTGCASEEGDLCYAYFCGALAGLWVRWIEQNCATPKEKVAWIVENMITSFYNTLGSGFLLEKP